MEGYTNIKEEFNKLIERLNGAETWFNNNPGKVKEVHIKEYNNIIKEATGLGKHIEFLRGYKLDRKEILGGITNEF